MIFAPLDLMAFWTAVISFFKIGMVQREIETIREIFFVLILNTLSGENNSSNVFDISAIFQNQYVFTALSRIYH